MRQQFVVSDILKQLSMLKDAQIGRDGQLSHETTDLHLMIVGRLSICPLKAKVWIEIPDDHPLLTQLMAQRLMT